MIRELTLGRNLIDDPAQAQRVEAMTKRLFDELEAAKAVDVKFHRPLHGQQNERLLHPHH